MRRTCSLLDSRLCAPGFFVYNATLYFHGRVGDSQQPPVLASGNFGYWWMSRRVFFYLGICLWRRMQAVFDYFGFQAFSSSI